MCRDGSWESYPTQTLSTDTPDPDSHSSVVVPLRRTFVSNWHFLKSSFLFGVYISRVSHTGRSNKEGRRVAQNRTAWTTGAPGGGGARVRAERGGETLPCIIHAAIYCWVNMVRNTSDGLIHVENAQTWPNWRSHLMADGAETTEVWLTALCSTLEEDVESV